MHWRHVETNIAESNTPKPLLVEKHFIHSSPDDRSNQETIDQIECLGL